MNEHSTDPGGRSRQPAALFMPPKRPPEVRTRGPIRELEVTGLSAVGGSRSRWLRLSDLTDFLREQVGNLPLTVIVHGPTAPSATTFLSQLRRPRQDNDDAYWLVTPGGIPLGEVPAFRGTAVLDLSLERDKRLYRNLIGDIVFFPAAAPAEAPLAADFGRRARTIVIDHFGQCSEEVSDAAEDRKRRQATESAADAARSTVCLWYGSEKLEALGARGSQEGEESASAFDLDAIGEDLQRKALLLQGESDRRFQFQTLLENLLAASPNRPTWRQDLIWQADKHHWPTWAVQSVGHLYVPLAALPDGRRSALVWHHLSTAVDLGEIQVARSLCQGEFHEVYLSRQAAGFLVDIAQRFEEYLPASGTVSDRGFLGLVAEVLHEVELEAEGQDQATVLRLGSLRRRVLAEAAVLSATAE